MGRCLPKAVVLQPHPSYSLPGGFILSVSIQTWSFSLLSCGFRGIHVVFPACLWGMTRGCRGSWDSLHLCGACVAAWQDSVCLGTWKTSNTRPRGTSGVKCCFSLHGCYFCSSTGSSSGGKSVDRGIVASGGKAHLLAPGKKYSRN